MQLRYLIALAAPALWAQADSQRAIDVLRANCASCHGSAMQMSSLRLDSRDGLVKGGAKGPAITPGDAAASRLMQMVTHSAQPSMPPGRKLPEPDIDALRKWIDAGASWPKDGGALEVKAPTWWSFKVPTRPEPPAVSSASSIDRFVDAKLKEKTLPAAARASKAVLVRRAYLDLHGLPPTFEQSQRFVSDSSPNAWEKLLDELLASPRYGEKWGRHWLDLVRYGDTAGFEQDPYILDAWRYRDYVIDSFNADKPYDRFLKEQIAADEIWPEDPKARTGTGYFSVGTNRDMLFKVEDINRVEQLTDYVDTTSSVFMGLSVGCARCHDHKFDPIPQRDYYRMQAIFTPAIKHRVFLDYNGARGYDIGLNYREFKLRDIGEEISTLQKPYREALRKKKIASLNEDLRLAFETPDEKRTPAMRVLVDSNPEAVRITQEDIYAALSADDRARIDALGKKLVGMFAGHTSGPIAPGVMDFDRVAPDTWMPVRGASGLGEKVGPGLLTALGGSEIKEPPAEAITTFRRKALAEWLANPQHPLTARVMVNRIWQYHFGRGIVATPSDFGTRGQAPSHPELLDWLATEFVTRGWSMKAMHKLMMSSEAYQRESNVSADVKTKDPENVWLSHFSRRRLEAEEVRDSVLQAAGTLNLKMGGRPVVPPHTKEELFGMSQSPENFWPVSWNKEDHVRRSVYTLIRRSYRPPLTEAFDGPDGTLHCARRDESTVAPQALTLMNSDFAYNQARALAARLSKETTPAAVATRAYREALGRDPSEEEVRLTVGFLSKQQKLTGSLEAAAIELARGLFNLNEFLYVD
ncbi:MAG TPA: PSD1 and planctomycete cytochrome C domain-containing protein [Bryobacteraceae bacterium]|nr:PSD1 and planctomycete cytochrome C domain-containing protein [Bryobacteraceae bacterium]